MTYRYVFCLESPDGDKITTLQVGDIFELEEGSNDAPSQLRIRRPGVGIMRIGKEGEKKWSPHLVLGIRNEDSFLYFCGLLAACAGFDVIRAVSGMWTCELTQRQAAAA